MGLKRILFVHHGNARGGAFLSLLSLVRSLDQNQYEAVVCDAGEEQDPEVRRIFSEAGFHTCACRLPRFAHTTGGGLNLKTPRGCWHLARWLVCLRSARRRLGQLLAGVKPDLVHFNSLTLAPYAVVPRSSGIPTVVHVRESVLQGLLGLRRRFLRSHLMRNASQVVAVCVDNLERLDLPEGKATVVYNPVEFNQFDHRIDGGLVRRQMRIPSDACVVLFAGGSVWEAKGLIPFLKAMGVVRRSVQNLVILMPSFRLPPDPSKREWTFRRRVGWLLGMFRNSDLLYRLATQDGMGSCIVSSDFTYDIEQWIAASDVVCVPHVRPHFSRTVMEAGAMKKPVVAFGVGGVTEVVHHEATGMLVRCGDVRGLADAIELLLGDHTLASRLGQGGYQQAIRLFASEVHASAVARLYSRLIPRDG